MFAVVASGFQGICKTQRQLDTIIAIYPYPKFRKCRTAEEGRRWLRENKRGFYGLEFRNYGDTAEEGYAEIKYEIKEDRIEYWIDTSKLGYVKLHVPDDLLMDMRAKDIHIVCSGIALNDDLIIHHIIAIRRVLRVMGEWADVSVHVPDISVYLAATKYRGTNYMIKGLQQDIQKRLGAVAFTVESG